MQRPITLLQQTGGLMDIHPVFVGLVAGMVAFALSCPFVLWIALPAHEGGSLHRRLFGNTSRRRALVVIAGCAGGVQHPIRLHPEDWVVARPGTARRSAVKTWLTQARARRGLLPSAPRFPGRAQPTGPLADRSSLASIALGSAEKSSRANPRDAYEDHDS